ncbi:MAG TPA: hypothetical protein VED40_12775 [Azospirillaceae bacterium]|nr:hypothetical protein [Azospirillaceae bacterium]
MLLETPVGVSTALLGLVRLSDAVPVAAVPVVAVPVAAVPVDEVLLVEVSPTELPVALARSFCSSMPPVSGPVEAVPLVAVGLALSVAVLEVVPPEESEPLVPLVPVVVPDGLSLVAVSPEAVSPEAPLPAVAVSFSTPLQLVAPPVVAMLPVEEPDEPVEAEPVEAVSDEPVLDEPVLDEPVLDEPIPDEAVEPVPVVVAVPTLVSDVPLEVVEPVEAEPAEPVVAVEEPVVSVLFGSGRLLVPEVSELVVADWSAVAVPVSVVPVLAVPVAAVPPAVVPPAVRPVSVSTRVCGTVCAVVGSTVMPLFGVPTAAPGAPLVSLPVGLWALFCSSVPPVSGPALVVRLVEVVPEVGVSWAAATPARLTAATADSSRVLKRMVGVPPLGLSIGAVPRTTAQARLCSGTPFVPAPSLVGCRPALGA